MAHIFAASTVEALASSSCEKFHRDYWNIDDILAEEELVPCSFRFEAKGLGYLDQLQNMSQNMSNAQRKQVLQQEKNLPAGAKVDVPVWLAVRLAQRELVELRNPKFMSNNYYAQLKAGSEVVTMRSMSPYLFEVVVKICEYMTEEQAKEAVKLYQSVFVDRFAKMVVDHSN